MAEPFRPNLFQHAPARVSSDPQPSSSASSKKPHLHSLHHHGHRHHHHHRHSSRHRAKEVVQSAVQLHPPTSFGDLLKQARGSNIHTPAYSRAESIQEATLDGQVEVTGEKSERIVPKPVRPEDVQREGRKFKVREEELRTSLQSLSDQSLKTSRRLDDTYYSILEKVSILRQTIGSLQELSGLTKELHETFEADTKELAGDIRGQFEGFGNFEAQKHQVTTLETRIKVGRERADALKLRLAEARKNVEARAESEAQLEARNTRRLRILWGILGAIAALIIVAILFQQLKPIKLEIEHRSGWDFAQREQILDAPIPDGVKQAIISSSRTRLHVQGATPEAKVKPMTEPADDHRLRAFDEL